MEDKDTREVKDMTICEKMQICPPHRHQESILAKLTHHSHVVALPCTLLPRPRFLRRRSDSSFECVHPEKVDGEGVATYPNSRCNYEQSRFKVKVLHVMSCVMST